MEYFWARLAFRLSLPVASQWAKRQESRILKAGVPLAATSLRDAERMGVRFPDRVRVRAVDQVPEMNPMLRIIARKVGLCSPLTRGMSLRYGIFIHTNCQGERALIVHELAHTLQYERLGGIRPFLKLYLYECLVTPGYPFGPLEQEAIQIENSFQL
jgi:hypothetical protein